ncbi:ATP synthase epsilon chain [BD1-7 clade bacterium]|uniref:ATP synthase epsilon chain n=1 Tax=BD1-7 clade bacterium TaxID=2029982 RepID=A0A5S9N1A1_9GAMM|nr:ATP synthase epsilon chain [BD1-7 clade bacterium]CAA0083125.1 ATP synthase epsilon chain [BD1-7 clade bacterium]
MAMTVHCDIVSAEQSLFSGLVEMVIASGDKGELGILYDHAPLLTELIPGPVRLIKQGGEEEVLYVSGGYLEVQPTHVSILADTAIRAHDIDEAAAKKAEDEARRALTNQNAEMDFTRASVQLAEAMAQIRALEMLRKRR